MIRRILLLAATAMLVPAFAAPAAANPRILPIPVADPSCARDCRSDYRVCLSTVREELNLCRAQCTDLEAKAREACAADPRGEDCLEARRAAAACLAPCRDVVKEGVSACREGLRACNADCPDRRPPVAAEPTCLDRCRVGLQDCRTRAHAAVRECHETCVELRKEAAELCRADRGSVECQTAQRAASACVKPCQERMTNALRQCLSNANSCKESCRPATTNRR